MHVGFSPALAGKKGAKMIPDPHTASAATKLMIDTDGDKIRYDAKQNSEFMTMDE